MPTDGQLISLMSHTIGSIGQVLKHQSLTTEIETEIKRIYDGYIQMVAKWS